MKEEGEGGLRRRFKRQYKEKRRIEKNIKQGKEEKRKMEVKMVKVN